MSGAPSRQQLALCAAIPIDDHAEAGEDGRQRDEQTNGANRYERLVVDVGAKSSESRLQRGRDHEREQDRRQ
jgi:hypothetical protein